MSVASPDSRHPPLDPSVDQLGSAEAPRLNSAEASVNTRVSQGTQDVFETLTRSPSPKDDSGFSEEPIAGEPDDTTQAVFKASVLSAKNPQDMALNSSLSKRRPAPLSLTAPQEALVPKNKPRPAGLVMPGSPKASAPDESLTTALPISEWPNRKAEEVTRSLGAGNFGKVDEVLIEGRSYARKTSSKTHSSALGREHRALKALKHPNIIELIGSKEHALYLELADDSLKNIIDQVQAQELPLEEVTRIIHEIAQALAYMHEQGYVHADIKADNILLKGKTVKISDFGSAFIADRFSYDDKQAATTIYSPPEHLNHELKGEALKTIDVWAFGLLLFALLKEKQYITPFVSEDNPTGAVLEVPEQMISLLEPNDILKIPTLLNRERQDKYDPKRNMTDLMLRCLDLDHQKRPTMSEICALI